MDTGWVTEHNHSPVTYTVNSEDHKVKALLDFFKKVS
jgi:hypothetical protein